MKLFFVKSIEPFISKLPAAAEVGAGMRYTLRDAKILADYAARRAAQHGAGTFVGTALRLQKGHRLR